MTKNGKNNNSKHFQQHTESTSKNSKNQHLHQGRFGLSVLNSMIGEYLEKENNPLAVQMGFYHESKLLSLDVPLDSQFDYPLSNKVVVFVHGLTNLENVWDYPPDDGTAASIVGHYIDVYLDTAVEEKEQNYGTKLKDEQGFTPLFLRYNTGLSLEKNSQQLCKLLNKLNEHYPINIDELVLVGYGMGGRLLSHTQYAAQKREAAWLSALSRCVYLGNFNEGSLLTLIMRLGSLLARRLPNSFGGNIANWLDDRSKHIQEQSRHSTQRKAPKIEETPATTFLEDKRHFFIKGDLKPDNLDVAIPQNSLVPPTAPLHSQNAYIEGISPIRLTHSDRVYSLISDWMMDEGADSIPVKTCAQQLAFPIQPIAVDNTAAANDATNRVFIAGTVDLMASAYDKTVETIETMHYSLAEEPFYVMDKVPVVSQIAKPVEAAQREVLDNIYRSLRNRGKKMHKFASDIV